MTALCPNCGHDLALDEPLFSAGLSIDPRGDILLDGAALHLTASERIVLHSIVKSAGRAITRAALMERLGSEGDGNVAEVMIHRVRAKLGHLAPAIETIRGVGYRWAPDALVAA